MEVFFGWVIFSVFVGFIGMEKRIGFLGAFFVSLLFSPLIGFIVAVVSPSNEKIAKDKELASLLREQNRLARKALGEEERKESTTFYPNIIKVKEIQENIMKKKNDSELEKIAYDRVYNRMWTTEAINAAKRELEERIK